MTADLRAGSEDLQGAGGRVAPPAPATLPFCFQAHLEEGNRKGVTLDKIYATSNTPDGIKACRDLGFEELEPLPGMSRKRFLMETATSPSLLLEEYRQERLKNSI